jgi:long-chain fatty acid transport protein
VENCKTKIPLPANFLFGVAYEVLPKLLIEADYQFVSWSAYNELKVEIPLALIGQAAIISEKNWKDASIGRIGIQYQINKELSIRGGVIYDQTPQPIDKMEPMLPDADRLDYSLGVSHSFTEQLQFDFAYMLVLFKERRSEYQAPVLKRQDMSGPYFSNAHIMSMNLSYSF